MLSDISSALLTILLIAIIAWFVILVISLVTLIKRNDILFPVKIFWAAVIFFAPVIGLILYLAAGPARRRLSHRNTSINRTR